MYGQVEQSRVGVGSGAANVPQEVPSVPRALTRQGQAVERLRDVTNVLRERLDLAGVLRPNPPATTAQTNAAPRPAEACTLANTMTSCAVDIHDVADVLADVLARIEL